MGDGLFDNFYNGCSSPCHPDLALDKFSGTDPNQNAESFIQSIERKINFALGDAPANPDALAKYTFRKNALFSSLIRGPAAEWYESNIEAAAPWEDIRTNFLTRFSDERNKFRYRMELEHVFEDMARKFGTFSAQSKELWIKAGLMT